MKTQDNKIEIKRFTYPSKIIVENRILWGEILIRVPTCKTCGDEERITLQLEDVPKLIKALETLSKIQEKIHRQWSKKK